MLAFQHGSPRRRAHKPVSGQHPQGSGTEPSKHFPEFSGHLYIYICMHNERRKKILYDLIERKFTFKFIGWSCDLRRNSIFIKFL